MFKIRLKAIVSKIKDISHEEKLILYVGLGDDGETNGKLWFWPFVPVKCQVLWGNFSHMKVNYLMLTWIPRVWLHPGLLACISKEDWEESRMHPMVCFQYSSIWFFPGRMEGSLCAHADLVSRGENLCACVYWLQNPFFSIAVFWPVVEVSLALFFCSAGQTLPESLRKTLFSPTLILFTCSIVVILLNSRNIRFLTTATTEV